MNVLNIAASAVALALVSSAATAAQQPTSPTEEAPPAESHSGDPAAAHKMPMPNTSTTTRTAVESTLDVAPSATTVARPASVTTTVVANAPIPDTAENRAKYGQPMSNAGKRTAASGN